MATVFPRHFFHVVYVKKVAFGLWFEDFSLYSRKITTRKMT